MKYTRMEAEEIRAYCLAKKGVSEGFPFGDQALVFKISTKMFLLLALDAIPLAISVKTDPEWSTDLRAQYPQIYGAYHMNKTHWNTLECEGIPKDLIKKLIDHSYDLVFASLPKKLRDEI